MRCIYGILAPYDDALMAAADLLSIRFHLHFITLTVLTCQLRGLNNLIQV